MPVKVKESFIDKNGNELEFFVNDKCALFMSIFKEDEPNEPSYAGFITLKKDDVKKLIKKLKALEPEVNED